jgi:glycosyltransferase involved in cell wall biosynthesis
MRVLHVYSGNLLGGIESMLVAIARARADWGALDHEFALAYQGRLAEALAETGAAVHSLPPARLSRPLAIRRARAALADLLRGGGLDCVVCHAAWSQAIFGPGVRRGDVPLVFWAHDALSGRPWTERQARRVPPDLAIANSRFTAATLPAIYARVPCVVVYPPTSLEPSPQASRRRELRAALETPPDAPVIVQASRLDAGKGHASLLTALSRLRTPRWIAWFAGGIQRPGDARYLSTLRQTADRLGIASRVRFLGQRTDLPAVLAAADLYCQPGIRPESFGLSLVEALAAGLPVVATAMGGACEIVDDTCGQLVTPGSTAALASAIDELMADRAVRDRCAAAGPARARALCDPRRQLRLLQRTLARLAPQAASA